jgi:hypothetical protein
MYNLTIQYLRQSGYKVGVYHHRRKTKKGTVSPKGGKTILVIDSPSGQHFEGIATCSKEDNYNKKLGIRIALGRSGVIDYI